MTQEELNVLRKKKKNATIEILTCLFLLAVGIVACVINKDPNSDLIIVIFIGAPVLLFYTVYASLKIASANNAIWKMETDIEDQRIQEENEKRKAEIQEQIKTEETPDLEKQKILDEMKIDEEMRKARKMAEGQSRSPLRTLIIGLTVGGIPAFWAISKNGSGEGLGIGIVALIGIALVCGVLSFLASNSVKSENNEDKND